MKYWLVKTEPNVYSWDRLVKEKNAVWDGVRNYQARNNMKLMKKGEKVLFYHTGEEKQLIGAAEVTKEFYAEKGEKDWVVVEIKPIEKFKKSVPLSEIKTNKKLSNIALVRNARLSVMELNKDEFEELLNMQNV